MGFVGRALDDTHCSGTWDSELANSSGSEY